MNKLLTATACIALLSACSTLEKIPVIGGKLAQKDVSEKVETELGASKEIVLSKSARLDAILAAQPAEAQARFDARNPKETLLFLGIEPGMNVGEMLPGGGWYSKILLPYVGAEGTVVGIDYDVEMWKLFGGFVNEAFLTKKATWTTDWVADAKEWTDDTSGNLDAFVLGSLPEEMKSTLDAVLAIRAMHHLNRFEEQGQFQTAGLQDIYASLKPGGIFGVVQHRGPEANEDTWAEGDNGYVKQSQMIAAIEAAGFKLVDKSELNANPADVPGNEDKVWRLPPTLGTSKDNPELAATLKTVGESDRMTLKFRKPV